VAAGCCNSRRPFLFAVEYSRRMASSARIWIAGLLLASSAAHAVDVFPRATKKLDAHFDGLQAQGLVSGSIAISERGVLRYQRSVGFASIENGVPQEADAGTRYRIGEVTRLFTAALALQLAEQATITLDNKLAEFYPDLPNAINITYRNLLQHRSGLSNYTDAKDFDAWRRTPRSHDEMLKAVTDGGVKFPPGERVEVNDTNYLLIGYVLEKVHERSYDDIVRRQIANKLGMVRTYYAGTSTMTSLEAAAYQWTAEGWRREVEPDPSVDGGAGGLVSNATDLVAFMDALFAGKVVSKYSLGNMRGEDGAPGIGMRPAEIAGRSGFGERGTLGAFNAAVYHFPDEKISIAWTSNASRMPMDQILDEVLKLIPRAR
jgi:D-alanyl-D-alanine carboxypeptidase